MLLQRWHIITIRRNNNKIDLTLSFCTRVHKRNKVVQIEVHLHLHIVTQSFGVEMGTQVTVGDDWIDWILRKYMQHYVNFLSNLLLKKKHIFPFNITTNFNELNSFVVTFFFRVGTQLYYFDTIWNYNIEDFAMTFHSFLPYNLLPSCEVYIFQYRTMLSYKSHFNLNYVTWKLKSVYVYYNCILQFVSFRFNRMYWIYSD